MAKSKSTKKFEKRHLKDTLERRKDSSKVKQKQQIRAKQKAKKAQNRDDSDDDDNGENDLSNAKNGNAFESMTVDEFFAGGFDIPEKSKKKRKRGTNAEKRDTKKARLSEDDEEMEDEEGSDLDMGEEIDDAGGVIDGDADSMSDDSDDEAEHRKQLETLAKKDPEFYNHLKENDAELLDFEVGDFEEIDELSDDESGGKKTTGKEEEDDKLSIAVIEKWEMAISSQFSLRSTREVILAFRAAVHLNDTAEGKNYKYNITNSEVYNKVVVTALTIVPKVLNHHIPPKHATSGKIYIASDSKKFKTLAPMIRSHVASTLHLMASLSDSKTLRLTLSSVLELLPYLMSFRKILKDIVKLVASIWSDTSPDEATKIAAFLVLRRSVVISDAGIREVVLKAVYQGLVKGSRTTSIHTIKGINLVKNSAAELWGIDPTVGYTTGFGFIRQLAMHLRSTITNKTKDSYKVVYNWQCVHSLDFWSRVLSQHCSSLREAELAKESPLRPLIYPVVQVTLGVMRLIPTAQYFPLKFQLFRSLLRISQATNTYIPLAASLYEVLTSAEMRKAPKSSMVKPLDFSIAIRAGKSLLRTRVYQDGVGEQLVELFSEYFVLYCKSIAFPELALPVIVMLKRWLKEAMNKQNGNKNGKVNSAILVFIQKLESNSKWIEQHRAKVHFAPNNRSGVEKFLSDTLWESTPLGAFVVGQRKARDEKQRVLEDGHKRDEAEKVKSDKSPNGKTNDFPSDDDISDFSEGE